MFVGVVPYRSALYIEDSLISLSAAQLICVRARETAWPGILRLDG